MLQYILIQFAAIAVVTLLFVVVKLLRAQRRRYQSATPLSVDELPTVSVCIPARNETNAMAECLERVLASDYPKMEVIVLDDHSSDNTSHIIKAFAHAGVRFVAGEERPVDWLGKNYALETLLEEASGQYVLMMDVDTRLQPDTIQRLATVMHQQQLLMLSVIPQRYDLSRPSAWFATLRYFWELVLDGASHPGVSPACWMVDRRSVRDELHGLHMWRDEVQPESFIAREYAKTSDYLMLVSTPALGVSYEKKWTSQLETSRRLLLPRFGNSLLAICLAVGLVSLLIVPQILLLYALLSGQWAALWVLIGIGVGASLAAVLYYRLVWRRRAWLGMLVAPYVVWQELVVLVASAIGYHRGTITWKGRAIERPARRSSTTYSA